MALIYKEFLAILRDKRARLSLILPPIFQLFLFAFAATLDVKDVPIGILNRDNGEQAFELCQRFQFSRTFSHIVYLHSVDEIRPFIENQRGVMVLSIDEQFSRNIDARKTAAIQLILDGRKSNTAQVVAGYAGTIVDTFNRDLQAKAELIPRAEIVPRNFYNPNLLYYWYTVPSLCGILVLVQAIVITAMSIARERELGTFDQLLVSPLSPLEILIGKSVPAMVIAMLEGSFILVMAIFAFEIPFTGSYFALYFAMLIYVLSTVGCGIFISSLCSNQQQALLGSFVLLAPSIALSGFATPIENMPELLQYVTYILPLRYFLVIVKGSFLKAMPFSLVFDNTWPMLIIALFTLAFSGWFFRHRLD